MKFRRRSSTPSIPSSSEVASTSRSSTPEYPLLILIGQHRLDAVLKAADGVWATDLRHHVSVACNSEHEIGSIIIYRMQAQAQELALFGDGKLGIVDTISGLSIIRRQVVDTVFHELNRAPGDLRQCASNGDHFASHMLATKAATCIHGIEVDHIGCQLQATRNQPPYIVEHIGGRPDLHATARGIVLANRSGWLHGCSSGARPAQAPLNDMICTGKVTIHVAKGEDVLIDDV